MTLDISSKILRLAHILLHSPYQARKAFDELRRYHTRPIRLNWAPENVHFGKTYFKDPNIDAWIFGKIKELPGAAFLCFALSTTVPKNGPKSGPKFKKRQKMTKIISPLDRDPI